MDKYHRVSRSPPSPPSPPNLIYTTFHRSLSCYFKYALRLLEPALLAANIHVPPPKNARPSPFPDREGHSPQNRNPSHPPFSRKDGTPAFTHVTFKGAGRARLSAVAAAEFLKHLVPELVQTTAVGTQEVVEVFEPSEEGLDVVEERTVLEFVAINLSVGVLEEGSEERKEVMGLLTENGGRVIDAEVEKEYLELREAGKNMKLKKTQASGPGYSGKPRRSGASQYRQKPVETGGKGGNTTVETGGALAGN